MMYWILEFAKQMQDMNIEVDEAANALMPLPIRNIEKTIEIAKENPDPNRLMKKDPSSRITRG